VPSALNTCPRTALSAVSPPLWLLSVQVTTKPPSARPVMLGAPWPWLVVLLTRTSPPWGTPSASKTWARTAVRLVSPPLSLLSIQATAKPPFSSAVTSDCDCCRSVVVLTRNSPPVFSNILRVSIVWPAAVGDPSRRFRAATRDQA